MVWYFAELGGSLLVRSMNSQVFKSSNNWKMRRFFSDTENIQILQSTKWFELIELGVLLASLSLREVGQSHLRCWESSTWKLQGAYTALLCMKTRMGRHRLVCFLPGNKEHPLPWASVHPMVMRTSPSKHGAWQAGLSQCLFIWVQIFITSAFQYLHMQTGDLKGNSCENNVLMTYLKHAVCDLGMWILCGWKKLRATLTQAHRQVSCFAACVLDFVSFNPQVIRCTVQKYLECSISPPITLGSDQLAWSLAFSASSCN